MDKQTCPKCKGSKEQFNKCPTCRGKGHIGKNRFGDYVTCPDPGCKGLGEVVGWCSKCKGRGWIKE